MRFVIITINSKIRTTLMMMKGQAQVEELLSEKDLQRPFQRYTYVLLYCA